MKRIRTVLVDDESPARERLKKLLHPFEYIEVVGEASDGAEALDLVEQLKPDLLFLDIQMPVVGGLEVAASLPSGEPTVIFCTAYDEYAVDAFELRAIDYLLKPVSRSRLKASLERLRARKPEEGSQPEAKPVKRPFRFLAKRAGRYHVVPVQKVLYFSSEEGLTRLITEQQEYWMQPSLSELEHRLRPGTFFRISRAVLVNLNCVHEVVPLIGGYGDVVLSNGVRLSVSRRRFKDLVDQLSEF